MDQNLKMCMAIMVIGFLVLGPGTYTIAYLAHEAGAKNFLTEFWGFDKDDGGDDDDTVVTSLFKYSAVKKGATATAVTSGTTRAWYDANKDGKMSYSELGSFTESSGVYSSVKEYPIGEDFDIWVQVYATNYQLTYQCVHMTGQRNSDGSAKPVDNIELILTDDALTVDGLVNKVAWDDSSDYNATLKGTSGLAEVSFVLSASTKGISSQIWEGVDYMSIYGIQKDYPYVIKWDQITESGIANNAILAPTFFGVQFSLQDKEDLKPAYSNFDFYYQGVTNYGFAAVVSSSWGPLFYQATDTTAPRPTFTFDVGTITAAGTTVATVGVALWQGLTYEEWITFNWGTSASDYLGTPGNDWDFTI